MNNNIYEKIKKSIDIFDPIELKKMCDMEIDLDLNYFFAYSFNNGNLDAIKFFWNRSIESNYTIKNFSKNNKLLLKYSCTQGYIDVVKWILDKSELEIITYDILNETLKNKKIEIFFYLCETIKKSRPMYLKIYINQLVENNIKNGNIQFAKMIYEKIYDKHISKQYTLKFLTDDLFNDHNTDLLFNSCDKQNDIFVKSCQDGDLFTAKRLWYISRELDLSIDIHKQEEKLFRECCIAGHYNIVKWLYDLSIEIKSPINIRANKDEAFLESCKRKKYEITGWLCSLCSNYKINVLISGKYDGDEIKNILTSNNIQHKFIGINA